MTAGELRADPEVLARISSMLRGAGDSLASVGDTRPPMPDAGELSGAIAEVLNNFAGGAGELIVALLGAGDLVAQGGTEYQESEDENRAIFHRGMRVE